MCNLCKRQTNWCTTAVCLRDVLAKAPDLIEEKMSARPCCVTQRPGRFCSNCVWCIVGKSVAVLEGRVIGGGQTGRTTAHLMPWNDDYYHLQVGHARGVHGCSWMLQLPWFRSLLFFHKLLPACTVVSMHVCCMFSLMPGHI